ncbi:MAG: aspartate carbamoyltransferase [endosymbiont of Galathealinum brachiosum]|uniref:Aspartate carbamoyltransferase n=1 Tax=endosymbiont of Galathealinum brachiosum TaxID=2200906 RepID=A0A370D6X8_9GAMM|nr:MAG: aspartate carbamoyltransferase [endosymbiont of Galathealinum brachiosum]
MFQVRNDEPQYAFLNDETMKETNCYGKPIQTVDHTSELHGKSLNINLNSAVGENPNRYKQHGFHFTADNCIGCHACEAACSEKNDNPAHIAFRSVGYVEGGTYPDFKRLNISMACNHCDDPVCLKGCPTRAYTKFAEYGAVLQDSDICFGCGYCTWVCPYNAPQLDPVKGQVSKCNMCVDRLEVGLKPACVSACLGNALNFGVIENTPEKREQAKVEIPGFPRTDITNPNIRFQQTRDMPNEMTRTDSMAVKYHKDIDTGVFEPVVDKKKGIKRSWNLDKLRSREDPLVIFTLVSQAVIGAFLLMFIGNLAGIESIQKIVNSSAYLPMLFVMLGLEAIALFLSTMHLGKPLRFYRAFNNLKYSPVSREVAGIAVFFNSLGAHFLASLVYTEMGGYEIVGQASVFFAYAAAVSGPIAIYFMHKIYRIEARPFWNHWQVLTAFYGNMISLGSLITGLFFVPVLLYGNQSVSGLLQLVAGLMFIGLMIEAVGHYFHAKHLNVKGREGAVSYYEQVTTFGKTNLLRLAMLFTNILVVASLMFVTSPSPIIMALWVLLVLSVLASSLISRAMFYVMVVPTTMPGAFFWKNKGFEEHARETGLANTVQAGIIADAH